MAKHAVTLDDKYTQQSGRIFLSALQALVRLPIVQHQRDVAAGLNTAGFISGYRGSPLGTYDTALWAAEKHLIDNKIVFQPGVNEELAAASMKGTQWVNHYPDAKVDGVFALWYGKHLGVERACEALKQGNYDGASKNGGVLVLCGDDHGGKSSITAAESDHVFITAQIPLLYPADTQEIIDYGLYGWALSRFAGLWCGLKTVTDTVEAAGTIELDSSRPRILLPDVARPPEGLNCFKGDYFPLPQERRLMDYKLPAARSFARANGIDRVVIDGRRRELGIVTTGKVYLDVREALRELGITEARARELGVRLYKVGMPWPLESESALEFCRGHREILVVDEKRPVIEEQLTYALYSMVANERPRIVGKKDESGRDLVPGHGERSVNEVIAILMRRLRTLQIGDTALTERMDALDARRAAAVAVLPSKAIRTPYFCSGCPHNSSTKTVDESMTFTGVGCYGMIPMVMPQRNTQWAAQMGAEGTLWVGMKDFLSVPHAFQNLGDGTYFHSGILAVRAALAAKANITYKLLYNDAVAMTGGQPVDGEITVEMMANQLYWEGVKPVIIVTDEPDKYPASVRWPEGTVVRHRRDLEDTQRELQKVPGVSAIIYDQTCAAEKRRRRKRGEFPDPDQRVFINQEVCEGCGDCSAISNCLSVQPVDTELGRKRHIDQSSCNKDFSCVEGFCPSFVTVHGGKLRKAQKTQRDESVEQLLAALPTPTTPSLTQPYNILLTGIGGTGVLTVGAILGMAAHVAGLASTVMDVTGMAQKGGSVLSNIRIAPPEAGLYTPRLWQDATDLLLGCDLIVTAAPAALQTLRVGTGQVVVNNDVVPTAQFQTNQAIDFSQASLLATLRKHAGADFVHAIAGTELTTKLMGDSIGSNIFMLGFAIQKGWIPVPLSAVEEAIRLNGVAVDANLQTLSWGRLAAHDPAHVTRIAFPSRGSQQEAAAPMTLDELIAHREQLLTNYQDSAYAADYRAFVDKVRTAEAGKVGGTVVTLTVARVLARLMAYKDEFEVARLYTNGDFKRRLQSEFDGDFKLKFILAPPLLSKRNARGELLKRSFGGYMQGVFAWLARFKALRKTRLNIFGYTAERKMERALIPQYKALVDRVIGRLTAQNVAEATELVRIYEDIKGYGHVKERNFQLVKTLEVELLSRYSDKSYVTPTQALAANDTGTRKVS